MCIFLVSYCWLVPDVNNLYCLQEVETFHSLKSPNSYIIISGEDEILCLKHTLPYTSCGGLLVFWGLGFLVSVFFKENSRHIKVVLCNLFCWFKISLLNFSLNGSMKSRIFWAITVGNGFLDVLHLSKILYFQTMSLI